MIYKIPLEKCSFPAELRERFWLWGGLFVGAVVSLIAFKCSELGKRLWDGFVLNAVVIRNGYEVCREIRSNPNWDSVRIVMLTARGHDIDRRKGLRLGADAYVTKPFSTRDIVLRVQDLLGPETS